MMLIDRISKIHSQKMKCWTTNVEPKSYKAQSCTTHKSKFDLNSGKYYYIVKFKYINSISGESTEYLLANIAR